MSRIGKKPVVIPADVKVSIADRSLKVTGPQGDLRLELHPQVQVAVQNNALIFTVSEPTDKKQRALWGLFRSLAQNYILGVTTGFTKQLEVNGVGYKVALQAKDMVFALGFSHPVIVPIPANLNITVDKNTITISGNDKQLVGQFSANIRRLKPPEPYKGKGIRYVGENVRRKAGKSAKAVGK